jgi:hypothetical protein
VRERASALSRGDSDYGPLQLKSCVVV